MNNENDVITVMKLHEDLLLGYIYLSTNFHDRSGVTEDFQDRVELTHSTRASKVPSPEC